MPTYEYECKKCSYTFEAFQAMSDEPLKKCPKCKKELRRLIFGGAGVIFKGSGFYVTDKAAGSEAKTESKTSDAGTCPAAAGGASKSDTSKGGESPCSGCPKNKVKRTAKSA